MTKTLSPNTPSLQHGYEYAERWREKHDAVWIADHVWNMIHSGPLTNGYAEPWRGFSVEDYRLNDQEAAFYKAKIAALIEAKRVADEKAEKQRLAIEADKEAVRAYLQHLKDSGITKMQVEVTASVRLKEIVSIDREVVKYRGEQILEEATEDVEITLEVEGFTNIDFDSDDNYEYYVWDANFTHSATYEVDVADEDDPQLRAFVTDKIKNEVREKLLDDSCDIEFYDDEEQIVIDDDNVDYLIVIPELETV